MKLSKYASLVKKEAYCTVYRTESDGVWLGSRAAIYRASGLPWIEGREQVRAVLSLDDKQMDKIFLQEFDCADLCDVQGMNLQDYDAEEQDTKPVALQTCRSLRRFALTSLSVNAPTQRLRHWPMKNKPRWRKSTMEIMLNQLQVIFGDCTEWEYAKLEHLKALIDKYVPDEITGK
jgi:hypothetical protein